MSNITACMEPQTLVSSILKPVYILEFIFGLPGNVFALWILFFKSPWKACNVYLFCLVISDLLLLTGLPFHIDYLFRGEDWIFGESFCRLIAYIISVNYSASMAFMSILAVDRFFRILHPHHRICRTSVRQAVMLVTTVWLVVLLLRLPTALSVVLTPQKNSSKLTCHGFLSWTWPSVQMRIYNSVQLIEALFAFALVVICFVRVSCHVNGRQSKGAHRRVKRAVRLLLFLVIMFVLCFLPKVTFGIFLQVLSCSKILMVCFHASLALAYMNSALDSVIYCHINAWFRDTLKGKTNSLGLTKFKMSAKTNRKR
ncbi:Oxoeicosanoid receptor 1 [Labeo rohita]|uniref:Oxoeicosanoid receptor 1 n=1 Tax=Labeo rohita TaxID=84645 RepID=A0ABQ8M6C8_LABRO|nr:oxoeicosanoid receptor 1 [Labeo rohita]KAI2658445.1 Oxoeicosanoid receptor 1 [Labeo rohita]